MAAGRGRRRTPRRVPAGRRRGVNRRVVHQLRRTADRRAGRLRPGRTTPMDPSLDEGVGAAGPPVVSGGAVVVARTDGSIEAIAVSSGRRLWSLAPEATTPAGAHGRDIRALASQAGMLLVTSLRGPDPRLRRPRSAAAVDVCRGPRRRRGLARAASSDRLYVPYSDGSLVALDLRTGQERWRTIVAATHSIGPRRHDAAIFDSPQAALSASIRARPDMPPRRTPAATDERTDSVCPPSTRRERRTGPSCSSRPAVG